MPDHELAVFQHGVHNLLQDENIPADAAQDESNWITQDGRLKLVGGRLRIGTEGAQGSIQGEIFGYKIDGTKVHWRKCGTKIQYFDGAVWQDTVTGLTSTADYAFSNYSSLAGTFTYAFGVDGIFKMHNAVPASYCSMYSSSVNFKGFAFIDKGRTILWNRPEDKTGLYGSKIDPQGSNYTPVSGEATASLTGTLAFKAGGATRNCFGVTITITAGGEVFTDNYLGVLTGSAGGTGTINYITGAYTLSHSGVGTAAYQWEDSNSVGVTDFRKSATRVAGEGFILSQDEGGDAILNVLIGQDGAYYSLKSQSAYQLTLDDADVSPTNLVYRRNIGVPFFRAGVSTNKGIVFINTANQERPELTILQRNPISNFVEPVVLFPQFKFANYDFSDCNIDTSERYTIIFCKKTGSISNDTILMCDLAQGSVDIVNYFGRTSATDSGSLYIGSSVTQTIYELFNGFDDDGLPISNFWAGAGSVLRPLIKLRRFIPASLKKVRKLKLRGMIDADQNYSVYISYDDAGFQLVGTIRGDGSYVDYSQPQVVGGHFIGQSQIGGDLTTTVYPYFTELKLKTPKFRKRAIKIVANGIGYVDIDFMSDHIITTFEDRLPKRFRQKQNVSLDGTQDNLATPQY